MTDKSVLTLLFSSSLVLVACSMGLGCTPKTSVHGSDKATSIASVNPKITKKINAPAFSKYWHDGKAEISVYYLQTKRYGVLRKGCVVLIYVIEPMDSRTWIKDDRGIVSEEHNVEVIKLNHIMKFRTGIYPYSVMTSVFSPVVKIRKERFAPVKISFSTQEWCGNIFQLIYPKKNHFKNILHSYFSIEGDLEKNVKTPPEVLYEDALLIQLRELDGPFAGRGDWRGYLVPTLWSHRKTPTPLTPVEASITRKTRKPKESTLRSFTIRYQGMTKVIDVKEKYPHVIAGWRTSDGENAKLIKSTRLAYWKYNGPDDERMLSKIGLDKCLQQ